MDYVQSKHVPESKSPFDSHNFTWDSLNPAYQDKSFKYTQMAWDLTVHCAIDSLDLIISSEGRESFIDDLQEDFSPWRSKGESHFREYNTLCKKLYPERHSQNNASAYKSKSAYAKDWMYFWGLNTLAFLCEFFMAVAELLVMPILAFAATIVCGVVEGALTVGSGALAWIYKSYNQGSVFSNRAEAPISLGYSNDNILTTGSKALKPEILDTLAAAATLELERTGQNIPRGFLLNIEENGLSFNVNIHYGESSHSVIFLIEKRLVETLKYAIANHNFLMGEGTCANVLSKEYELSTYPASGSALYIALYRCKMATHSDSHIFESYKKMAILCLDNGCKVTDFDIQCSETIDEDLFSRVKAAFEQQGKSGNCMYTHK